MSTQRIVRQGARDAGEILIAESCTEKETIAEALNQLESLIDSTPTVLNQFNSFWSCKPIKKSYNELVAFYFVLVNECKEAKPSAAHAKIGSSNHMHFAYARAK